MQGLAPSEIFLFEDFRLDRRGGLFRCNGADAFEPVAIGSRALDILGVLIERAGEVVSKDEIIAAVWPETVVEGQQLNGTDLGAAPGPRSRAIERELHSDDHGSRLSFCRTGNAVRREHGSGYFAWAARAAR
jgi:hypothetical protein